MIIVGKEYKKSETRIDVLKRFGLVMSTTDTGTYMLSPLGKMVKDRIIACLMKELSANHAALIELPVVIHSSSMSYPYRECAYFASGDSSFYICDALNDAEEAQLFLSDYSDVVWVKNYIDTTRRMVPTKLRFHSYGLLCVISRKTPMDLCKSIMELLCSVFVDLKQYLTIRQNSQDDYSIRYCGRDSFTIAHCHQALSNTCAMCGISIEKILLMHVLNNQSNEEKTYLFDNVLVALKTQDLSFVNIEDYDFIDLRELKIASKCMLLEGIGVKRVYMLTNTGNVKLVQH